MIIPPNISETKRNKILIPIKGLQFSIFFNYFSIIINIISFSITFFNTN